MKLKDYKYLAKRLEYLPLTGCLLWKSRPKSDFKNEKSWVNWKKNKVGKYATYLHKHTGYLYVQINQKSFRAHRVIWFMFNGDIPDQIDHINHDRFDNRIENLRDVGFRENRINQSKGVNNTSGVVGVHWSAGHGKWAAKITLDKKTRHLGFYFDFFDAVCARKSAERKLGFHKNHGR